MAIGMYSRDTINVLMFVKVTKELVKTRAAHNRRQTALFCMYRSQVVCKVGEEFSRKCRVLWCHRLLPREGATKCALAGLMASCSCSAGKLGRTVVASRNWLPTQ